MARQRRLILPGAIYHVIVRGINRTAIFRGEGDRREFLRRLEDTSAKTRFKCLAWVLMPNHVHLLIRTSDQSLSRGMRILLTGYAGYFNRRQGRTGYLFQNRYKSILCQEETYLLELVRYLHLNPARAGMLDTSAALDRYPWSGHAALIAGRESSWQAVGEVLAHFGARKRQAIAAYRRFIADGWAMGRREELRGGGLKRSVGGWQGVAALRRSGEPWRGEEQILGDGDFAARVLQEAEEAIQQKEALKRAGWTWERLRTHVCAQMHVDPAGLKRKCRGNALADAKALIVYWAQAELGLSGTEIGSRLGITRQSVHQARARGERIATEKNLKLTN